MTLRRMLGLAAIAIAVALPAAAGPGEAGPGRAASKPVQIDLAGIDYVVLVWYRRDQPLETFKHQTYDVRKGEYRPEVDAWLRLMHDKHPSYVVHVRRVILARERGATEKLKVGSVIYGELLMAAAEAGVVPGAPMPIGPVAGPARTPGVNRTSSLPQTDRSFLDSSSTPGIPVYPRTRPP